MSEIKVSGLSHVYSADTPFEKIAIDNVNVEIPHGQLVGLIEPEMCSARALPLKAA